MALLRPSSLTLSRGLFSTRFASNVFQPRIKQYQVERAVLHDDFASFQELREVVGGLLLDRLSDVKASFARFPNALDIGSRFSRYLVHG